MRHNLITAAIAALWLVTTLAPAALIIAFTPPCINQYRSYHIGEIAYRERCSFPSWRK